jgi:hypothetical protein
MDIYVVFLPGTFLPVTISEEHSSAYWVVREKFHTLNLSKSAVEAIDRLTPALEYEWRKHYS